MKIAHKPIGPQHPVYIIAELSANHNQDFELAKKTIAAMAESGADAVKLQTYTADTITLNSDRDCFQIKHDTLWDGKNLHKLYQEAYTPWEWQPELKRYAESLGLACFSSPFDPSAVDFLAAMDVPAYKVASFEIQDIPLVEYIAKQGKPVIISTGIAEWHEIEEAIAACHRVGNHDIVILKCTSSYPTPMTEVNLRVIPLLREKLGVLVGLSDHTMGATVPMGAVALGACVIEKHFILDRALGGPDSAFSMEPAEFAFMVKSVRDLEKALGASEYSLGEKAQKSRAFGRSLFAVKDIAAGETFTTENIRSIRPADGMAPKHLPRVLGKKAAVAISHGEPLQEALIKDW
jgi:pseudaminic acid synthase